MSPGTGPGMETVSDCRDLEATLSFFTGELGWRIHLVTPADDPSEYVVEEPCSGGRLRLRRSAADVPVQLRVGGTSPRVHVAPNGSTVTVVRPDPVVGRDMVVPEAMPSFTVTHPADEFGSGRAGMAYRDLLPDRWGGRFVASHIRVDHPGGEDGEIADWVHFHRVRFQLIVVVEGWVDVVYEDQGEPFRMQPGDCVLQPPEIRHRVLRSSSGLEVIEVGCPAVHDTVSDPHLDLPNGVGSPERSFFGQRFVRHVAADASTTPWIVDGWHARDTGLGAATDQLVGVSAVTPGPGGPGRSRWLTHQEEFVLLVATRGAVGVEVADRTEVALAAGAAVGLPPGERWRLVDPSADHEHLVVSVSADAVRPA